MARNSIFNISVEEDDELENLMGDTDVGEGDVPVDQAIEGETAASETQEDLDKVDSSVEDVDDSLDVADELGDQADEQDAIIEQKPDEVTDDTVAMAQEEFSYQLGRLNHAGFKTREEILDIKRKYSIEAASTPIEKFKISTEAIRDFIFNLIQRIMTAVSAIVNFFRKVWRKILIQFGNYDAEIKSLINKFHEIPDAEFAVNPSTKLDPDDLNKIATKYGPYIMLFDNKVKTTELMQFATAEPTIKLMENLQKSMLKAVQSGAKNLNALVKAGGVDKAAMEEFDIQQVYKEVLGKPLVISEESMISQESLAAAGSWATLKGLATAIGAKVAGASMAYGIALAHPVIAACAGVGIAAAAAAPWLYKAGKALVGKYKDWSEARRSSATIQEGAAAAMIFSTTGQEYSDIDLFPICVERESSITWLLTGILKGGSAAAEAQASKFQSLTSLSKFQMKIVTTPLLQQYLDQSTQTALTGDGAGLFGKKSTVIAVLQTASQATRNIAAKEKTINKIMDDYNKILKDVQKSYIDVNNKLTGGEKARLDGEFRIVLRLLNSMINKIANTIVRGNIYFCKNTVYVYSKLYGGTKSDIAERATKAGAYVPQA